MMAKAKVRIQCFFRKSKWLQTKHIFIVVIVKVEIHRCTVSTDGFHSKSIEQHFNFYSCDCHLLPQLSNISRESFGCVGGHDCHQRFFFQHKLASCKAPSTSIIITSIWSKSIKKSRQSNKHDVTSKKGLCHALLLTSPPKL